MPPGRASSTANCSSRKDTSNTDSDGSGENHDRDAPGGHDITEEGMHRDIYRDGKKIRPEEVSPPIPANEGFDAAEEIYERTSKNSSRGSKNGTG